ncbi:hypothetical protein OPIT5_00280 (plasmid) [Opitutaceae bacterium TAV5]|nr:hypothetical protein OPIT5_00280 [Opitutaceae bacterium TAV5]
MVVTKVADPMILADTAKTAASTAATLSRATEMVRNAQTLLDFAGNPKVAIKSISDLKRISQSIDRILGNDASYSGVKGEVYKTMDDADYAVKAWERVWTESQRLQRQIDSYGKTYRGNVDLYRALDAAEGISRGVRTEIKKQNEARAEAAKELAAAHKALLDAQTESEKQAAAAQIAAVQAQTEAIAAQQQALIIEHQMEKADEERKARESAVVRYAQRQADAANLEKAARKSAEEASAKTETWNQKVQGDPFGVDYSRIR